MLSVHAWPAITAGSAGKHAKSKWVQAPAAHAFTDAAQVQSFTQHVSLAAH